jgi:hypothetical protein
LVTIGAHAFEGDSFLETIDFGANLEYIGDSAFKGCVRVLSMTIWTEYTPNVGYHSLSDISSYADLYVLGTVLKKFQVDNNWNRFILKEIGATETTVTENNVTVVSAENSAEITWPAVNDAFTYEIAITKNGETICTLIFNANGQLVGIAFAQGRNGVNYTQQAQTAGYKFTVTGLTSDTKYNYSVTAKDNTEQPLDTKSGSFTTTGSATSHDQTSQEPKANSQKVLINGQILILRGDRTYTVTGQEVK